MTRQDISSGNKPRLLFVDDEQRVLNSMRIMFKRQFELFLASSGAEAIQIIKHEDIDVIVADHRMPQMTGVDVLTQVRALSPRTVRILLTGYADLDAVEGSINDGEVFRFLTKPCAPDHLRETIALAAKLASATPADSALDFPDGELGDESVLEMIMAGDADNLARTASPHLSVEEPPPAAGSQTPASAATSALTPESALIVKEQPDFTATDVIATPVLAPPAQDDFTGTDVIANPPRLAAPTAGATPPTAARHAATAATASAPSAAPDASATLPAKPRLAAGLGIVVFSTDEEVLSTVQNAVRGRLPVYAASNVVKVVKILTDHQPGVLVTDISDDKATIQSMTARLKEHLPELVTIAVSEHRDVLDMVWLINHGQIFRFLRKPLSSGRCAISLQAALKHHRMLLRHPELVKRHEVAASEEGGLMDGMLSKLKNMRRLWASA
jgi:DNA-binding NtrC family response regulator